MKSLRNRGTAIGIGIASIGLAGGAVLASTGAASAATDTVTSAASSVVDKTKSIRSDEQLLTGDTATKVQAAALAKYPGATVQRVETDSEGVYEAHLALTDGSEIIVQVGSDFAVTGTQTMGGHGGGGQRGGYGAAG